MSRCLSSNRLCLLLVSLVFMMTSAVAQPGHEQEDENIYLQGKLASLSINVDSNGSAIVMLGLSFSPPSRSGVEEKLNETLGFRLEKLQIEGYEEFQEEMSDEGMGSGAFFGRNDRAFGRQGLLVSGRLDLTPLANELRGLGVTDLAVMITTPQSGSYASINGATLCSPYLKNIYCLRSDLTTTSFVPITFAFGYRFTDVLWKWLPLAVFLLLPLGLTLWMRRRALRITAADPAATWFSYFRFLNLAVIGTWLLWLPLYAVANIDGIFRYVADRNHENGFGYLTGHAPALPLGFEIIKLVLYFLPPALITVLCHLLSHKVFTRLRGMEWSAREVMNQAIWSQAASLVPLFFFLVGITSLNRNASFTATCFILAVISWLICSRLSAKAQNLTPYALTTGELRDRIFALAARAGVALKQIYILPAGKGQMVNAFARNDNAIILTDSLLRNLSAREVGGVVAHELAHLKEKHPRTLGIVFISTIVAANVLAAAVSGVISLDRWAPALFSIGIAAAMLVTHFVSRGYERHADVIAIALTGDPEGLITGLAKLARLNLMPVHWGSWDEKWTTHPSTLRRMQYLASYSGISPQHLEGLLAAKETEAVGSPELQSDVVETEKVFSTSFKTRIAFRISWTIIGVVTFTPVLLAYLLQRWPLSGSVKWVAYACGIVLTFGLYQLLRNFMAVYGYGALQRGLRAKLEREGFKTEDWDGQFVGFAPAHAPRIYENFYIWDTGFLFLTSDRLCYVGEETRFALRREDIVDVYLGAAPPDWIKRKNLYIKWSDMERGVGGTFYFCPGDVRSLWQMRSKAPVLCKQIQTWAGQPPAPVAAPAPFAGLSTPSCGSVTSLAPSAILNTRSFINSLIMFVVLTLVFGVAVGLSWAGIGYAVAVTVCLCLLDQIPRLSYHESAEEPTMNEGPGELSNYPGTVLVETES